MWCNQFEAIKIPVAISSKHFRNRSWEFAQLQWRFFRIGWMATYVGRSGFMANGRGERAQPFLAIVCFTTFSNCLLLVWSRGNRLHNLPSTYSRSPPLFRPEGSRQLVLYLLAISSCLPALVPLHSSSMPNRKKERNKSKNTEWEMAIDKKAKSSGQKLGKTTIRGKWNVVLLIQN